MIIDKKNLFVKLAKIAFLFLILTSVYFYNASIIKAATFCTSGYSYCDMNNNCAWSSSSESCPNLSNPDGSLSIGSCSSEGSGPSSTTCNGIVCPGPSTSTCTYPPPGPYCDDGICNNGETIGSCPSDCDSGTTPSMSGTLTPATSSCVIASGASSCTINHTWTTTNPVATSSVTSNKNNAGASAPGTVVANGNNGGPTAFTIPWGGRIFYLYNNSQLLATSNVASVSVACVAGTSWNGSICVAPVNNAQCNSIFVTPSGTLTPGQAFTATISMGNTGTTVWNSTAPNNYHLTVFPWSATPWNYARAPVTTNVANDQNFTFTLSLTAPSTPGTYSLGTKMLQENVEWFEQICNLPSSITVSSPPPVVSISPSSTSVSLGQAVTFTVSATSSSGLAAIGLESTNSSGTPIANLGESVVSGNSASGNFSWTPSAVGTYYFDGYAWNAGRTLLTRTSPPTVITVTAIPPPTNFVSSCSANGTTANLSWTLPSGYTLSYFRVTDDTTGTNPAYWIPENISDTGPATSFATIQGHSYSVWVHTRLSNGTYSTPVYSYFTCPIPAPVVTISPSATSVIVGQTVNFTINATSNSGLSSIGLESTNSSGAPIANLGNTPASGSSASGVFPWTPSAAGTYYFDGYAWNTNSSALTRTSPPTVITVTATMSGTLTPASPSCTIASGASSCNVTLTWSTTNPQGTSAVTASGMTNVNGNSGSQAFAVPYSSRTFYLYNNAVLLATSNATSACVSGTSWNGSTCGPVGPIAITSFSTYYSSISDYPTTNNNTVYWTTTGNPTSCVATGASPWGNGQGTTAVNASITTGSHYQGVYPSTGTYTYNLTCYKAGTADATGGVSVIVSSANLPTVTTTTPVTSITSTTATGGGNISSNGGSTVTVSGITWSTSVNPTTALATKTTNGWAIGGPWTSNMTSLTPNTLYHVRAYATNSVGTAYGADVTFTTSATPQASFTLNPTTMSFSGVVGEATPSQQILQIVSNGTSDVWYTATSNQGWCYINGASSVPGAVGSSPTGQYSPVAITVAAPSVVGPATHTCYITVTDPAASPTSRTLTVTYVVTAAPSAPTVITTTPVTSITSTTATGGGNISSNGGATVTVSGIAWSTSANPTTANTKTTNGWAIGGPWTSNMTGLTPNTLYHVRAYATNSVGTAYGADVTFTTSAATPISISNLSAYRPSISDYPTTNDNSIYWTTTGSPTSCVATGSSPWGNGEGTSAVNASIATGSHYQGVYPSTGNYSYTLTCSKLGTADAVASITVPVNSSPMSGTLTPASPSCTIASGASSCNVTLTWSTTNPQGTSAVTASGMTNVDGNSGSQAFAVPYSSRTFYLYNNAVLLATSNATSACVSGTSWNGSTCAVSAPSPISVSLSADPASMTLPTNSTTLTWLTTGSPTSCVGSGSWSGSKLPNGSSEDMTGLTAQTYTYTITCSKSGVSDAVSTVNVNVASAGGGAPTLNASSTNIYSGDTVTLTWTNAGGCTATPADFTSGLAAGSDEFTPATTTTYTINCGAAGTASVTINVKRRPIIDED